MKYIVACFVWMLCINPTSASTHGSAYIPQTYYLAPSGAGGSDSNNGTSSGTPWLTPNHPLHCGDTIVAAAGTYASSSFNGSWGAVSGCPAAGIYFATLKCAGPYVTSCVINDTNSNGMVISQSNWAVSGWYASSTNGTCFAVRPASEVNIQYIAVINSIANGCAGGGIATSPYFGSGTHGVDQFAVVGVIVYNAAYGTAECFAGISVYDPKNANSASGTHVFIAGAFSWANIDGTGCASGLNSDGQGVIFDNWSNSQTTSIAYTGQGVVEQSLFIGNGAMGVQLLNNTAANVYVSNVTSWGNSQMSNLNTFGNPMGDLEYAAGTGVTQTINSIFQSTVSSIGTSCSGSACAVYAALVIDGGSNNVVNNNYIFGVGGQNTDIVSSPGFSFGAGNTYATPNFVNPSVPGAPSCSGYRTTTACMATVIANFMPQAGGAVALGYQAPGPCMTDANFPPWLAGIIPIGLITQPCGTN